MHVRTTKVIQQHSFWLSAFVHLLFLANFSFLFFLQPLPEKTPELYVPSYIYSAAIEQPKNSKPELIQKQSDSIPITQQLSRQTISQTIVPNQQAVHMMGEKDLDKPLIKLLGKALAEKIIYPKSAIDFNVKGIVYVGFVVHPDGSITDGKLVHSSGAEILDKSALNAVNNLTHVNDVGQYLKEPTFLVVGVIYG